MREWNDYRVITRQRIGEYGQHAPETLRGAGALMTAGNALVRYIWQNSIQIKLR